MLNMKLAPFVCQNRCFMLGILTFFPLTFRITGNIVPRIESQIAILPYASYTCMMLVFSTKGVCVRCDMWQCNRQTKTFIGSLIPIDSKISAKIRRNWNTHFPTNFVMLIECHSTQGGTVDLTCGWVVDDVCVIVLCFLVPRRWLINDAEAWWWLLQNDGVHFVNWWLWGHLTHTRMRAYANTYAHLRV